MASSYDAVIVGGGPAGLFAAHHLRERTEQKSFLVLEAGPGVNQRDCPADLFGCKNCSVCTVLGGLGGAGLHSDGKLILDLSAGGFLQELAGLTIDESSRLVSSIADTLKRFDGDAVDGPVLSKWRRERLQDDFKRSGLDLKLYPVRHLGTENLRRIMAGFATHLSSECGPGGSQVRILCDSPMTDVSIRDGIFEVRTPGGVFSAPHLVLAVGKSGAPQLRQMLHPLGVREYDRATWVGVRVEVDARSARELLELSFDPKISQQVAPGRRVKTHCFCRNGSLLIMKYRDAYLVGGHSPLTERNLQVSYIAPRDIERQKVNFNVLASTPLEQSEIDGLLQDFKRIGQNSVVWQPMSSFLDPQAPQPATVTKIAQGIPAKSADIRSLLDVHEGIGSSIASFLMVLSGQYPGLIAADNRVFGPALEWDFGSIDVNEQMETSIPGLFAVGDGAGLSQGIVHAGATGILAARAIQERLG